MHCRKMATSGRLTGHDLAVLDSIFNPNLPFNDTGNQNDCQLERAEVLSSVETETDKQFKEKELSGMEAAESGDLHIALDLFNQAIELAPDKAAGYNNRAQIYRLTKKEEEAMSDLDLAITLSGGQGAAACQAFTQRALLRRLRGDEDGCRSDFQHAANLGSSFAKQQLVLLNPYAALCNNMLSEMVSKLKRGEPTNSGDPGA